MRLLRRALLALPLLLLCRAASAQTPAAPEFIVNSYTTDAQARPSLSMDARGNFVMVWNSVGQDGDGRAVVGQRFDAAGVRLGTEFLVNNATVGSQFDPEVAVDRTGDFIVAWTDVAGGPEIKGRRFSRGGAAVGAEFRANSYTTGTQDQPAVASDAVGNFVVVWQSAGQDGFGYGVFGHRFDAGGNSLGSEFQVNTYTTGGQRRPEVAFTNDGGFVVVFDGPDSFAQGIHARRYDATGAPVGAEFSVETALASQFAPAVAALPQGGFVVAWTSYGQDGSHNGIYGRIFDANGGPTTGEFRANTHTTNGQTNPAVDADGHGGFVVIWESYLQDGSEYGVFGQRYDAAGARRGAEFALNTFTTGTQANLAVAADSAGNFVAAWSSVAQDGSSFAAVGRRYQGLVPTTLAADMIGNGVLEPAETAALLPSWHNTTTVTQTFQGTLSSFTGPPPGTYTIVDGLADYGATPAGTVHSCTNGGNCYALMATSAVRPALHWDASVVETLGGPPAALGLEKRWVVHLGDSFSDVPRSNAFYRFIETLLHHNVTGGCSPTAVLPGGRDDARSDGRVRARGEGRAGYVPPACTTPVFTDVPASNPFCRWIEELARRAVVSGCGGGNYCPTSAVTREQMAVFVLRTLDPALNPPACTTPIYTDVPASSGFCRWIEELTRRAVVSGCGGGNYCPTAAVTREQMGVFISVTFGLTLYGP